ncbi:MAG TPA: 3-hydroxyacyl-CoA dehydrogenase family protein [Solirubrobacteraceae bacterium]|nr:3-hydroxyacyl-CoA dehydrogenase family protein [Solirubrobacteraceae bacterium]
MVAIIGGGRMGSGIAEAFAAGDLDVRITDAHPELSAQARERVIKRARGHVDEGLIPAGLIDRAQRVQACDSIAEASDGADLVLEAVAEDMEVKHDVLAEIERAVDPDAVIATNTSSLPVDRLAEPLARPERFLGMHWFNPPEWTPGVEIVAAPRTDPAVVERVVAFLSALGKAPAVVKASTGFVANRLQMALLCEAVRCVEDGIATPQEIDEVVRSTFGFRLPFFGPFQIADMAGLDVYSAVIQQHRDGLGERFFVPELLRERVERGETGTSAGAGFYAYEEGEPDRLLRERDDRYAALAQLLERLPPQRFTPREE